jgi:type II secretory pathway component PulK
MITLRTIPRRRAVVLLAVLVVVVLLSLAAYQYSELMTAEYHAAHSSATALQARAAADSGVWFAAALLSNPDNLSTMTGNPWDNAPTFQDVAISADGTSNNNSGSNTDNGKQMLFSLVSVRNLDDPLASSQPYRFGVVDESGKINLNSLLQIDPSGNAGSQMLMMLPNMTQEIANSILDWMDTDDTPRQGGSENDYYSGQSPPYQCKNGPFDSLEELLLVSGVTPQLLFGNDRNRNGVLDPGEDDGTGQTNPGWLPYLTVYSRESNADSQGNPRIYLNDGNLNELNTNLTTAVGQNLAQFIIAYRLYGGSSSGGGSGSGSGGTGSSSSSSSSSGSSALSGADSSAVATQINSDMANSSNMKLTKISSLFSLVNASVSVKVGTGNSQRTITYNSPLKDPNQQQQLLPLLLDETTTSPNAELAPRININTASQVVLSALPGLSDSDVQTILTNRPQISDGSTPDPSFQTVAWLVLQANFSISKMQTLENYITARTQVYRIQSLGYASNGGPVARVEAVIDTNLGRPRVLYWRDLSELGKGFDLSQANSNNSGSNNSGSTSNNNH